MAKRTNTADAEMIKDINRLRKEGIKDFFCMTVINKNGKDKWHKPVIKHTAQGISAYANEQYKKYGDYVTVIVDYLKDNEFITYTTYNS